MSAYYHILQRSLRKSDLPYSRSSHRTEASRESQDRYPVACNSH